MKFKLDTLITYGFDIISKTERTIAEGRWNSLMIELNNIKTIESILQMMETHLILF